MKKNTTKLNQLTSLRFFAALMILIHHNLLGITLNLKGIEFAQGVSFFFVLSGFILMHVYQKLDTWNDIKHFWKARIARIYPAYLSACLLGFGLLSYKWDNTTAATHLCMVQAWLPIPNHYFSYNAVGWSISTELFFYFVFPLILYKWHTTWKIKCILSITTLVFLITIANRYAFPVHGDFGLHGLLYIHPISRLFEFIVGVYLASSFVQSSISSRKATIQECGALIFCFFSMYYTQKLSAWTGKTMLGTPTAFWIKYNGSVFAFGLLIFIIAQGRGIISHILSHRFLVVLGELSFSLYLIHQILFIYYQNLITKFHYLPPTISHCLFLIVLLVVSYMMWSYIEIPGKRLILRLGRKKLPDSSYFMSVPLHSKDMLKAP